MSLEEEIITRASEALKDSFNVQMSYIKEFNNAPSQIQIKFLFDNKEITKKYDVEIYKKPHSSLIGQLALKQRQTSDKIVFITEYVPPKFADKLRELDIAFFDANGNAYFNDSEFYIFVNSHGRNTEIKKPNTNLIFQPSGLQLLFVLLSLPDSENKTYRELAEMSGISLGSVSDVMNALKIDDYLVRKKDSRILFRKDELLKRWVQGFAETLRHKLLERQYESENIDWWKETDLTEIKGCWSGEIAADMMTGYLNPTKPLIYAKSLFFPVRRLAKEYKLRKADKGNIKIRQKFWNFNQSDIIAPPLLVYADLLATAESRNIEAAQIIYDEHLARLIE
ncbi:type IV toxin-antitoxin system AbiEi family antitoxin [soil metagenome]